MPNHRINQRITRSDKFYTISWKAQLTYLLGFAFLDDYGVWTANPHEVWKELFVDHKQIKKKDIIPILEELAEIKLIKLYAIDGKLYQQYENFNIFQTFGQGYNKKSSYPTFEKCNVDAEHNESNPCNWVYSGSKGCLGVYLGVSSPSHSHSNTHSNTHSYSYKEEEIEKLGLSLEEKEVFKCFIHLGEKIREDNLENWKKWLAELKKENPNKDFIKNSKKWRDYFELKSPKRCKNSFRNWIEKDYADKKVSEVDNLLTRKTKEFNERYKNLKK